MDDNVQPGAVSTETPSTEVTPPVATPQPLTQEQISKMIEDAINPVKEAAKREIQSVKDKAKSEVEKERMRTSTTENLLKTVRDKIQTESPDLAKDLELAESKEKLSHYQRGEVEQQMSQQRETFDKSFREQVTQFTTSLGLDPNDKRLDWADDVPYDYLAKMNRIQTSIAKIQKEETKKAQDTVSQQVKDIESKLRKELGLDSVDTSNPGGLPKIPDDKKTGSDWIKEGLKESAAKRLKK